jgi:2-amino-4-hydroxy-6-hydroxymethyldihydropteridine diphosphokinase
MTETPVVYLSGGSNLGDRKTNLKSAIDAVRKAGIVVRRVSSVYETEPVGFLNQPCFLNIAVAVETRLPPSELLARCQDIEELHGRVRFFPGAPRVLDLDILLYDDLVIDGPSLQIPHPRMTQRRFVLEPLAQIAPEAIHPVLKQTILSLLASCRDGSRVTLHSELEE